MDVLSDVLAAVRLTGAIFFDIDCGHPWVGESPSSQVIVPAMMPDAEHIIHVPPRYVGVVLGCCRHRRAAGRAPRSRRRHRLPGRPRKRHEFRSGRARYPDMSIYRRPVDSPLPFNLRHGSEGPERTRFVCGFLGCDTRPFNPLLSALPDMITAHNAQGRQRLGRRPVQCRPRRR